MLDFLKKADISDETINYINDNFSNNDIMSLADNCDECLKTIAYFKEIGITNIEEILINYSYIFYKLHNRILNELSRYDIKALVDDVNEDYTCIEDYI